MACATNFAAEIMARQEALDAPKESSWTKYFRDPTQWWDIRSTKRSPWQPDFTHKVTKEPLWMYSRHNPPWVAEELIKRGTKAQNQCHSFASSAISPSHILACCKSTDLARGIRLHDELRRRAVDEKDYSDALIIMYAKCGEVQRAQALLDKHGSISIKPWTALISCYVRQEEGQNALECFEKMQHQGIFPNAITYVCILKACALTGDIDKGKKIHDDIEKEGFLEYNAVLGNALVDMYIKCGGFSRARSVLERLPSRDVISWTALISGYTQIGQGQQAIECFEKMQQEGIVPNSVTYLCILNACASIGAIDKGRHVHDDIRKEGLLEREVSVGNALVDMYAKCDALHEAQIILEKLPLRDAVTWSTLIAGYGKKGQCQQAMQCLKQMQGEGLLPNDITYLGILKACAAIGSVEQGKQVHDEIMKQGFLENNVVLNTALLDMYAKCGAFSLAQSILENLPSRNVVCWNALITGYSQSGQGQQVLECFEQMQCEQIPPDEVTFCCVLNACNHLGLVKKGEELFDSMEAVYGLKPNIDCFTCMVDLFGRAGHLPKAVELIQGMPFYANSSIWHCLLGACRKWIDVEVGTWAFKQAVNLNMCDEAAYIMMASLYVAAGMHDKAKDIEAMRLSNKVWRPPQCSL